MILKSLQLAMKDLFQPKILTLLLVPALISFVFWVFIYIVFLSYFVATFSDYLMNLNWLVWLQEMVGVSFAGASNILVLALLVLLFLPVTYLTTVLLVSTIAMPVIVKFIQQRDFPNLQKQGSSFVGSLVNTTFHSGMFVLLFVLSLPLWMIPGMQILIPVILTAALNRRVFTYDALCDFYQKNEIKELQKKHKLELYGLGIVIGLFSYIPFMSFITPVIGGLAYTHLSLALAQSLGRVVPKDS